MPSFDFEESYFDITTPEMRTSRKRLWESPHAPAPKTNQPELKQRQLPQQQTEDEYDTTGDDLKLGCISRTVFLAFVKKYTNEHGKECKDVRGILSRKCYETWLRTRRAKLQHPEESFRRAITAHVIASDGRKAFPKDVEALLLRELRQPQIWECFREGNHSKTIKIGQQGFRSRGYHENNGYVLPEDESTPPPKKRVKTERVKTERVSTIPAISSPVLCNMGSLGDFLEPADKHLKLERNESEFTTNAFMSAFDEQLVPSPTSIATHHGVVHHDVPLHFDAVPVFNKTISTDSISRLFSDFHPDDLLLEA